MREFLLVAVVLLGAGFNPAWPQSAVRVPDCVHYFSFDAADNSGNLDNRQSGCVDWTVVSTTVGFATISLTFQEAPEAAGGVPGAWGAFSGTVVDGANPLTAITVDSFRGNGYRAFVRVLLGGLAGAGTVRGMVYGFRTSGAATSGIVAQVEGEEATGAAATTNPLMEGLFNDAGTIEYGFVCDLSADFDITAGTTQIIALAAGDIIRVCHISVSWDAVVDFAIVEGTGANCGTGTNSLTGTYQDINAMTLDYTSRGALRGAAAQALCVVQTGAANGGGSVTYQQRP